MFARRPSVVSALRQKRGPTSSDQVSSCRAAQSTVSDIRGAVSIDTAKAIECAAGTFYGKEEADQRPNDKMTTEETHDSVASRHPFGRAGRIGAGDPGPGEGAIVSVQAEPALSRSRDRDPRSELCQIPSLQQYRRAARQRH